MNDDARVYVAGHRGLVGSAIVRELQRQGCENLILHSRSDLDLRKQGAVDAFFEKERPDFVYLAAAKVGGIYANDTYPADFLRDNLQIQTNVIDAAWRTGVRKLCVLGSSCIYPKLASQPMREDSLLTGPLEPTNESYAIAKIAGIKMCQAYRRQYGFNAISLMPTNLYGPGDNFDLQNSHVLPALIHRFHEARQRGDAEIVIWGSGTPRREFLHCDDIASAVVHLMRTYESEEILNIGCGEDVTIRQLAELIASVVGFQGSVTFDTSKPDGAPRKLLDVGRLAGLGWSPKISLADGVQSTYRWFVENESRARQ